MVPRRAARPERLHLRHRRPAAGCQRQHHRTRPCAAQAGCLPLFCGLTWRLKGDTSLLAGCPVTWDTPVYSTWRDVLPKHLPLEPLQAAGGRLGRRACRGAWRRRLGGGAPPAGAAVRTDSWRQSSAERGVLGRLSEVVQPAGLLTNSLPTDHVPCFRPFVKG